MLRTIRTTIREHRLLKPGDHLLVAVSGGADSVALLHALRHLAPRLQFRLTVCHLNHRLRAAARQDAAFVKALAADWKLPVVSGAADVRGLAGKRGFSLEMAAREARYAFFARTARRVGADAVATAHTLNDNAETILLKLARGAGAAGLSGIAPQTRLQGLRVVRPMLQVSRDEVVRYLHAHRLAWREDESNRDLAFLRNRVRHEILPLFEARLNPSIRLALQRTADILREDEAWLNQLAVDLLRQAVTATPGMVAGTLDLALLRDQPLAARRRVVRLWLMAADMAAERIDFGLLRRVENLASRKGGSARLPMGNGLALCLRYGKLALEPDRTVLRPAFRSVVAGLGETLLPEQGLRIEVRLAPGIVRPRRSRPGELPAAASLNRQAVGRKRLFVRSWRTGDRMLPLGMQGSRKLQNVFVDAKLPVEQRAAVPVFECAGEVVWVPGYRIARGWEVLDPADPALQIAVHRL